MPKVTQLSAAQLHTGIQLPKATISFQSPKILRRPRMELGAQERGITCAPATSSSSDLVTVAGHCPLSWHQLELDLTLGASNPLPNSLVAFSALHFEAWLNAAHS
jgi:hypothetical protein